MSEFLTPDHGDFGPVGASDVSLERALADRRVEDPKQMNSVWSYGRVVSTPKTEPSLPAGWVRVGIPYESPEHYVAGQTQGIATFVGARVMVQMSDSGQLLGISDALSEPSDTTTQVERLGPVGQQLQKAMDNADEAFEKAAEVKRSADDAAAKALKAQEAAITARAAAKAAAEAGGFDPQKVAEMVSKVLVGDNAFLNRVTAHKVVLDPRNIVSDPLFTDPKAWYQATGGNTSEQYGLAFAKYDGKTDPSITGGPSYLRMRRHRGSQFNIMVANDCAPGGLAVGAGSQWVARIRYRWPADTSHSKSVRWCITYQRPAASASPDDGGDGTGDNVGDGGKDAPAEGVTGNDAPQPIAGKDQPKNWGAAEWLLLSELVRADGDTDTGWHELKRQVYVPTDQTSLAIGMILANSESGIDIAEMDLYPATGVTELAPGSVTSDKVVASKELWAKIAAFGSVTTEMLTAGNATIKGSAVVGTLTGNRLEGVSVSGGTLSLLSRDGAKQSPVEQRNADRSEYKMHANKFGWPLNKVGSIGVGGTPTGAPVKYDEAAYFYLEKLPLQKQEEYYDCYADICVQAQNASLIRIWAVTRSGDIIDEPYPVPKGIATIRIGLGSGRSRQVDGCAIAIYPWWKQWFGIYYIREYGKLEKPQADATLEIKRVNGEPRMEISNPEGTTTLRGSVIDFTPTGGVARTPRWSDVFNPPFCEVHFDGSCWGYSNTKRGDWGHTPGGIIVDRRAQRNLRWLDNEYAFFIQVPGIYMFQAICRAFASSNVWPSGSLFWVMQPPFGAEEAVGGAGTSVPDHEGDAIRLNPVALKYCVAGEKIALRISEGFGTNPQADYHVYVKYTNFRAMAAMIGGA